jgi:hypothetical protein
MTEQPDQAEQTEEFDSQAAYQKIKDKRERIAKGEPAEPEEDATEEAEDET